MVGPCCCFFGNYISLVLTLAVGRKKEKDKDKNKDKEKKNMKVKKLGIKLFREISRRSYNEKTETQ